MPEPVEAMLATFRELADHPEVFAAIADSGGDSLRIQKALRDRFPNDVVRLALTVAELRKRGTKKFPQAGRMWFDRERLEQATPWPVAQHKARRFTGQVWDFCCGLGSDAAALAGHCAVTAIDRDPVACLLTELNARALGVKPTVLCRSVEEMTDRDGLLHVDPDRRAAASKRAVRIEDYVPDIESLRRWTKEFRGGAIKLSPAANFGGKFEDAEVELVSLYGEAKEATIWFGELGEPELWRATVLPDNTTLAGDPLSVEPVLAPLGGYLYDPDPAVVRAGLVDLLCQEAGLARLDAAEEYLTSDVFFETPFADAFRVAAVLPNNEREVRKYLRAHDFGRLEIKARRLPIETDRLHRSLGSGGSRPAVVFFARIAGKARAVVAERPNRGDES